MKTYQYPVALRRVFSMLVLVAPLAANAVTEEEPLTMVFEEVTQQGAGGTASSGRALSSQGTTMAAAAPTASAPAATAWQPAANGKSCPVTLREVADNRTNKATAGGAIFPRDEFSYNVAPVYVASLRSGNGVEWLRGGLKSMRRFGVEVTEKADSAEAAAVSLRMAHAWSAGLNLNSHVMLVVSPAASTGKAAKNYHGFGTKTNWAGGNGEYMTVLNMAMNDALQAMAKDLTATACAN